MASSYRLDVFLFLWICVNSISHHPLILLLFGCIFVYPGTTKGELKTRNLWTPEEDQQLLQLVQKHGAKAWRRIAENVPGRDWNQCRERWHHNVNPDMNHGLWSEDEDKILMDNHKTLGSKWREYRTLLPGRTGKAIRERWWSLMKSKYLSFQVECLNLPLTFSILCLFVVLRREYFKGRGVGNT